MENPVLITAYYVQNLIQLLGPEQTSKILLKLKRERLFADVEHNLEQLAKKVAKDGKRVHFGLSSVESVFEKAKPAKKLTKRALARSRSVVRLVGARNVVGIVGKKVPGLSLGVGAGLALWRILERPNSEEVWIKAGAEIASGIASCFPGAGTAVSMTIDSILVATDVRRAKKNVRVNEKKKALTSGQEKEENEDPEERVNEKEKEKEEKEEKEEVVEKESVKQQPKIKKIKKKKSVIPSLYSFCLLGTDVCLITKYERRFKIPENFEIWFFCADGSVVDDDVYADVIFYSMLAKEVAICKEDFAECVTPPNCAEILTSGNLCFDYRIDLLAGYRQQQQQQEANNDTSLWDDFSLGLTKWTPKFDRYHPLAGLPISNEEEEREYFSLSQIVYDLSRQESPLQKCILFYLCDRGAIVESNFDSQALLSEKIELWRERIKQLLPEAPSTEI